MNSNYRAAQVGQKKKKKKQKKYANPSLLDPQIRTNVLYFVLSAWHAGKCIVLLLAWLPGKFTSDLPGRI